MTEPTTEAGRRLLAEWPTAVLMRERVLAIEAEARALAAEPPALDVAVDALRRIAAVGHRYDAGDTVRGIATEALARLAREGSDD